MTTYIILSPTQLLAFPKRAVSKWTLEYHIGLP